MKEKKFFELLRSLSACAKAIDWVVEKHYSFEEAYQNCPKGEWLLWLFFKTSLNQETENIFFLTKGLCANTVRNKMTDKRSLNAVDAAIAYGKGQIRKERLRAAAAYAACAYSACSFPDSFHAAYAAYAAAYTEFSSFAASYAAACASDSDARKKNELLTANICRKYLPIEIWKIKM